MATTERRRPDHPAIVRLIVMFVGVIGILSLIIGALLTALLYSKGETILAVVTAIFSITNGCTMGLLALLGHTGESTPRELGQGVVEAAAAADGLPVKPADETPPDEGEN